MAVLGTHVPNPLRKDAAENEVEKARREEKKGRRAVVPVRGPDSTKK